MSLYLLSGALLLDTGDAENDAVPGLLEEATGVPRQHLKVQWNDDNRTGTVVMTRQVPDQLPSCPLTSPLHLAQLKSWDCPGNPVVGGWQREGDQQLSFIVERMAALDSCLWFMECRSPGQHRAEGSRHGFPKPAWLEKGQLVWQIDVYECPKFAPDFVHWGWYFDPICFRETLYLKGLDRGARVEMRRGAERVVYNRCPSTSQMRGTVASEATALLQT